MSRGFPHWSTAGRAVTGAARAAAGATRASETAQALPAPLTSFVGRETDLAELGRLLAAGAVRLVTLVGTGGVGKTRLAIETAAGLRDRFADGLVFVELAPLAEGALVQRSVAHAVGVPGVPHRPVFEGLIAALRRQHLLLLLDNCEHVLDACASLTESLLRACPRLSVLATSREPLGITGEVAWRVPSLGTPSDRQAVTAADASRFEAMRLFLDRAGAAEPSFQLDDRNAAAVARICRALDGIPLALELAAPRLRVLSPDELAAGLRDRLGVLTGGGRAVVPRHQTLRATVEWSHELLPELERALFRRLAVFAGGWTLDAAVAVCGGERLATGGILDLLTRLVDQSLVVATPQGEETRYHLLETIRQYARERLQEDDEEDAIEAAHAGYYLRLAERAEPELEREDQAAWLHRLEAEHDNLRAALGWLTTRGRPAEGLRMAVALWRFWRVRGHMREGRQRIEALLALPQEAVPPALRARALYVAGAMAVRLGDDDAAGRLLDDALHVARDAGDRTRIAAALGGLAQLAANRGDTGAARALISESVSLHEALGNRLNTAVSLLNFGSLLRDLGELDEGQRCLEQSLALFTELGDRQRIARARGDLGSVLLARGDSPRATQSRGDLGNTRAARALYTESLATFTELGHKEAIGSLLQCFAALAAVDGAPQRAVRLAGAAAIALESVGEARGGNLDQALYQEWIQRARTRLSSGQADAAWAEGAAMPLEAAIAYALESDGAPHTVRAALTRRETEVVSLLAQGLTNRQIAERLVVSERTVDAHVRNIFDKLGTASRAQVAVWAAQHDLAGAADSQR